MRPEPASVWQIEDRLRQLPLRHQQALRWFHHRAGRIVPWPGEVRLPAGTTFLASTPKGIYEPEWTHYALSVRQSLDRPYNDQIDRRPDGTWSYVYFQEGCRAGASAPSRRTGSRRADPAS